MFRYAQVENALLSLHGPADMRGALRARLKYFQRLGITPSAPGKGSRTEYSLEDVAAWAFCLQLAECGLDPTRIAAIKSAVWASVCPYLTGDHRGVHVCALLPSMMTREYIEKVEQPAHPNPGILPLDGGEAGFRIVFAVSELDLAGASRALIVNLTTLRQRLVEALGEVR